MEKSEKNRQGNPPLTAVLSGGLGLVWIGMLTQPNHYKLAGAFIWLVLVYAALKDRETLRIHDGIPLTIALVGGFYAAAAARPPGHWGAGLALSGLAMLLLYVLSRHAIGLGDVKLVAALGIFLGPAASFYLLLHASWLGALAAVVGLLTKRLHRHQEIPFAPFVAAGYLLAISSL